MKFYFPSIFGAVFFYTICYAFKQKIIKKNTDGLALNLTAHRIVTKATRIQCLSECLYEQDCDGLNIEKLAEENSYRCHIFLFPYCSFVNFKKFGFIRKANTQFYQTNRSDCLSLYRDKSYNMKSMQMISPNGVDYYHVYCLSNFGGGWTRILKNKTPDFFNNRLWEEYKNGFGDPKDNYWIGNANLHQITMNCNHEFRFSSGGIIPELRYYQFQVHSEEEKYRAELKVCDSRLPNNCTLSYMDGNMFSTVDSDNDGIAINCSAHNAGRGWWFGDAATNQCHNSYGTGNIGGSDSVEKSIFNIRRINVISEMKPTSMSTNHPTYNNPSQNGNNGNFEDLILTNYEDNPWWQVDLQDIARIFTVKIYNALHLGNKRDLQFLDVEIKRTEEDSFTLCYYIEDASTEKTVQSYCGENGLDGRYVRITQKYLSHLNVREIQVYGFFL